MSSIYVVTKFEEGTERWDEYRDRIGAGQRVAILVRHFRGLGYDVRSTAKGHELWGTGGEQAKGAKVLRGTLSVEVRE